VLAEHVRAHALGGFDIEPHRLVARRRVEPVGPEALVERAEVKDGLAVQQEARHAVLVLAERDGAVGEV
jgi:hypothetical protein